MTPDPNTNAHVAGSWWASMAGWAYSTWSWFAGDANGMTVMIGITTVILTVIKIAQELQAWQARDEERQALRKLWERIGRKTRPAQMYVDSSSDNHRQ